MKKMKKLIVGLTLSASVVFAWSAYNAYAGFSLKDKLPTVSNSHPSSVPGVPTALTGGSSIRVQNMDAESYKIKWGCTGKSGSRGEKVLASGQSLSIPTEKEGKSCEVFVTATSNAGNNWSIPSASYTSPVTITIKDHKATTVA